MAETTNDVMTTTGPSGGSAAAPGDGRRRRALLRPWLGSAVRLGLAAVWLVAGGTKVGDLAASGRAVQAYDVMPYEVATAIGAALPFVEIALGVLLVVGLATRLTAGVSAALLVVFVAGIASAWARGLSIDCGCFGTGGQLAAGQSPSYLPEILRDLGFLILAGFLLRWPRTAVSVDGWLADEPPPADEPAPGDPSSARRASSADEPPPGGEPVPTDAPSPTDRRASTDAAPAAEHVRVRKDDSE